MIAPSEVASKSKESPIQQTIRIEPPAEDPFVAASAVSLTQNEDRIDFNWVDALGEPPNRPQGAQLFDDIVKRSRRDADMRPLSARAHTNFGLALLGAMRLDDAANEFEVALRLQPRHYVATINLARVRVSKGQFEEAKKLYQNLLKTDPGNPASLMSLANLAMRAGEFDEAVKLLVRVTDLDPHSALPKYHLAIALLGVGKKGEAIGLLRTAIRSEVRSAALYHALGAAYALAGQPKRAVRAFKSALCLSPELGEPVRALGSLLLKQGHFEEASELLADYLERDPDDFTARELLSRTYIESRRYAFARSHLIRVWEQVKGSKAPAIFVAGVANNIGATLDSEGHGSEATSWFIRSIDVSPDFSPVPYQNLAKLRARDRQYGKAFEILSRCRALFPKDTETPFLVAVYLMEDGCYDEASVELEQLIESDNASAQVYSLLGGILADGLRDVERAAQVLRLGVQMFPRDRMLANNLAYVLLLDGSQVEALRILESVSKEGAPGDSRDDIALRATWGLLNILRGNMTEGDQLYRRAEDLARQLGLSDVALRVRQKMNLELARAYVRLGDSDAALKRVEQGLAIHAGGKLYRRDLEALKQTLER